MKNQGVNKNRNNTFDSYEVIYEEREQNNFSNFCF